MPDHDRARPVLQRVVTGVPVDDAELREALRHARTCARCVPLLEAARAVECAQFDEDLAAYAHDLGAGEDAAARWPEFAAHLATCPPCRAIVDELVAAPPAVPTPPLAPDAVDELFERALTDGLVAPDAVTRERAARRLGERPRAGTPALAALAAVAAADGDGRVRAAAAEALERFDAREPLAQRVVASWRGSTAELARDLAAALTRLARAAQPAWLGVRPLQGLALRYDLRGRPWSVRVEGEEGVEGRLEVAGGDLWLTLRGLPERYEGERAAIAFPEAMGIERLQWSGDVPGLVEPDDAIAGGALRVRLGAVPEAGPGTADAFRDIVLLLPPRAV